MFLIFPRRLSSSTAVLSLTDDSHGVFSRFRSPDIGFRHSGPGRQRQSTTTTVLRVFRRYEILRRIKHSENRYVRFEIFVFTRLPHDHNLRGLGTSRTHTHTLSFKPGHACSADGNDDHYDAYDFAGNDCRTKKNRRRRRRSTTTAAVTTTSHNRRRRSRRCKFARRSVARTHTRRTHR